MHLRHEFLMLGILPIINRLKALNIAHLNKYGCTVDIAKIIRVLNACNTVSTFTAMIECDELPVSQRTLCVVN